MRKGMDIIVSEARRLTNMVEELLEFSRIEGRPVHPVGGASGSEGGAGGRGVHLSGVFPPGGHRTDLSGLPGGRCAPISGDPERLRQVFCNLLDNAAKHGGSGKRIDVSVAREGREAVIRIRDYGPGIPRRSCPM